MSKSFDNQWHSTVQYENEGSHVYVNASIRNNGVFPSLLARYTDTFTTPILENPSDYYVSIIRFSVDTSEVPLMIMNISGVNATQTPYQVTITNGADVQTTNLIWVPQSTSATVPTVFNPQDVNTDYYYLYSYQHFIDMVNTALVTSFNNLVGAPVGSTAPYMQYNDTTGKMEFLAQSNNYDTANAGTLNVYFNQDLERLFPYFNFRYGTNTSNNPLYAQIFIENTGDNVIGDVGQPRLSANTLSRPPANIPNSIYVMTEETPSSALFQSFKALVFTSASLPINPEYSSNPQNFNTTITHNNLFSNSKLKIVTDFIIDSDVLQNSSSNQIVYNPQAEYRLCDLVSNTSLRTMDIQIWWSDNYGNLYPLVIPRNSNCSIKFLFRNRNFMSGK